MVGYFDTSLLFNVYVPQATGTQNAVNLLQSAAPVVLTDYGFTELRNALRLARFRGQITDVELESSLSRLEQHLTIGLYDWRDPDWSQVYQRAEQIGDQVTVDVGIRSMDLIHLAVAMETGATDFYSADQRQCDGAEKIGMTVHCP
ncbi:MAG: putative nucleic acid-binding protein [Verrucomicrobiales bacterium]|jgi:predicted nucleic acid-binding protein